MTVVPLVPLAEVCTIVGGGTPRRNKPEYFGGSIPWATPTDVTALEGLYMSTTKESITDQGLKESSARLVPAGTVLMTSRATIGYTAITSVPMATNQGFANLICGDRLLPEYLALWLPSEREQLLQLAGGTTFKEISKSNLKKVKIPLPPIEEQRRIVDILNRAASIERLKARASTHLRDFIPALFNKMFGSRDEIANRYSTVMLKELADIGSGVTKGRKLNDDELVDVPYLRVANVQDGYLDLSEIKTIPIRESERDKYGLQVGDLVLTEGGDPDKLGRGALWQGELPYCAHQNHVFRVRPDTARVLGPYLKEVVGSAYGKAYFLSVAKQTTGIASINKTQLGQFPVPVPPMELQADFTKLVEAAQARARLAEKANSLAADLSRSLLDRLLGTDGTTRADPEDGAPDALAG